ncbi:unnamed protein product [Paramecium primaurelia]|uniref:RING-type domain-containing protein n=1 Tax=Paramecium primaurelia TaxID=5886 RepID=A0A8S1KC86_PARPR|nr:unnamed protein product [Paramecium primaurelia]
MYQIIIFLVVGFSKKLVEEQFTLIDLNYEYLFQQNHGYIIQVKKLSYQVNQFEIIQFPLNKNYFPTIEIVDQNKTIQTSSYESYAQKQHIRKLWLSQRDTNQNLTIHIFSKMENVYKNINETETKMSFKLSIYDNIEQQKEPKCRFPAYGLNCDQSVNYIDVDLLVQINLNKQSWFFAYYQLSNLDYILKIQNSNSQMGISLLSGVYEAFIQQPNFFQGYQLIDRKENVNINLKNYFSNVKDQDEFIIYIGVFNENIDREHSLMLELNEMEIDEFPLWAILTICAVILSGIIVSILIYYSYKKQYKKITYVKPVLEESHLNKFMPAQKMLQEYLSKECSICLLQFEKKEKFRITPCNHIFHDQCLQDWTKKNSQCPLCRQGLKEEEIQQFFAKIHSNNNESQTEINKKPSVQFIPLTNSDLTYQTGNKSDNSPSNNLCMSNSGRQMSIQIIRDEILE